MQRWLSDGEADEREGLLHEPVPPSPASPGLTATVVLQSSVTCGAFPSDRILVALLLC